MLPEEREHVRRGNSCWFSCSLPRRLFVQFIQCDSPGTISDSVSVVVGSSFDDQVFYCSGSADRFNVKYSKHQLSYYLCNVRWQLFADSQRISCEEFYWPGTGVVAFMGSCSVGCTLKCFTGLMWSFSRGRVKVSSNWIYSPLAVVVFCCFVSCVMRSAFYNR